MCSLTARFYNRSATMKVSSYVSGAARRLVEWVEKNLIRHTRMAPDLGVVAENRRIVDAVFELGAAHHYKQTPAGLQKSRLISELADMLELDCGSWRSGRPVCFCWGPELEKPKHRHIEECRSAFVMMYFNFYLQVSWPTPAVTRFTNLRIVDKHVQLGLAQHGVLAVLIEPFEHVGEAVPSLLELGAGMIEFQVIHRARKQCIYGWLVQTPSAKWHAGILSALTGVLDKLTYEWFGSEQVATMHDIIRSGGVIGTAQNTLLRLLTEWPVADASVWRVLDAVTGDGRTLVGEDVRRFMRRNLNLCAASSGGTSWHGPIPRSRCI